MTVTASLRSKTMGRPSVCPEGQVLSIMSASATSTEDMQANILETRRLWRLIIANKIAIGAVLLAIVTIAGFVL
jgi:hypothetical protein